MVPEEGSFYRRSKRWIMGTNVDNDWTKFAEIVKNANNMPESLNGRAHFSESTFLAEDELQSWIDGYWEIYNAYYDIPDEDENSTYYESNEGDWSTSDKEFYDSSDGTWDSAYYDDWNNDEWWSEANGNEAYYEEEWPSTPEAEIYYDEYGDPWEAFYEEGDDEEYDEDDPRNDDEHGFLIGAEEATDEQDTEQAEAWLAARKHYRSYRKSGGRGGRKGGGRRSSRSTSMVPTTQSLPASHNLQFLILKTGRGGLGARVGSPPRPRICGPKVAARFSFG